MDGQTVSLRKFHFNVNSCMSTFAMALVMAFALTLLTTHALQAQTFSVIHNFTNGADGANPHGELTVTSSGTLYGTATNGGGGSDGDGTVFKLTPHGSSFVFSPLYEFTGSGGEFPWGGVVVGPNGALYGTTYEGGMYGYGVTFELRPPATVCRSFLCYWNETVLYSFMGMPDGEYPYSNEILAFDPAGDVYGTTMAGGMYGYGTVFELAPSGRGYMENVIHNFGSGTDGTYPYPGVVLDTAGNVYGTTVGGGSGGAGTVYQLVPSNGGWLENVLVNFDGTDNYPYGNLIIDDSGNLYGTTTSGVVFKLAPSGGGFTYSLLYSLSGCFSAAGLAMDSAGDLFGVCYQPGDGWVFELTNCSSGTCTLVDLHDFSGSDGQGPWGTPVLDAHGNLYGTTVVGGMGCVSPGCGVVWEIAGVGAPRKN